MIKTSATHHNAVVINTGHNHTQMQRTHFRTYVQGGPKIVYLCQRLQKLADSRQSYCKNCQAYFFDPPCIHGTENSYKLAEIEGAANTITQCRQCVYTVMHE